MASSPLFRFESTRDVLNYLLQEKKGKNPSFSLRGWARKLGLSNPSFLSELLSGKKKITARFLHRILPFLEISAEEREYLECLCLYENAQDEEKEFISRMLLKMKPPELRTHVLDPNRHVQFMKWYYHAIENLPRLKDFKKDPKYMSKRLGGEISPSLAEVVYRDFVNFGIFELDKKGEVAAINCSRLSPQNEELPELPVYVAMRKESYDVASRALENQKLKEVFFKNLTFPVKHKDIPRIRKRLWEIVQEIIGEYETTSAADEIYALNFQFYRMTEPLKEDSV